MITLRPCPFCGGRAKCSSTESGNRAHAFVFCTVCGARLRGAGFHIYYHCKCTEFRKYRDEIRKQWNTRYVIYEKANTKTG